MSTICIIPARGGSKRIPQKNTKSFHGRPIISYSIRTAIDSGLFRRVIVSTDSQEISDVAADFGAEVPFLRSEANSSDAATLTQAVVEVIETLQATDAQIDFACCLLPTAVLVTAERLSEALAVLRDGAADCVLPVVEFSPPVQRSLVIDSGRVGFRWPEFEFTRTQDCEPHYHDSGSFYMFRVSAFLTERRLIMTHSVPMVLGRSEVQDIDTLEDWVEAEMKFQRRSQ